MRTLTVNNSRESSANGADPTVVELEADESRTYEVGDGETFENYLFDVTAEGSAVAIEAAGDGWTIRDVGVRGRLTGDVDGAVVSAIVEGEDATGLIERVYLGDGARPDDHGPAAVSVGAEHAGELTIGRGNFQAWPGGAVAASAMGPALDGGNGSVAVEQCYSRNNAVAQYQLGSDGSSITGSVAHVDDQVPGAEGRGIWARDGGQVTVDDCDVLLDHESASACIWAGTADAPAPTTVTDTRFRADSATGPELRVDNFDQDVFQGLNTARVDHDPDVSVPAGVPTDAEEAAAGAGE